MATGRNIQLTRQIGEHLVAAKLGRLGYIAAPFAGNVPTFDLLAADMHGYAISIQVKAINGPSWQFQATAFLEIEIIEDTQHVRGEKELLNPDLICVFVFLDPDEDNDAFYIFQLRDLQAHFSSTIKVAADQRIPAPCIVPCGPRIWNGSKTIGH